jgi:polyphosphate glucokinase
MGNGPRLGAGIRPERLVAGERPSLVLISAAPWDCAPKRQRGPSTKIVKHAAMNILVVDIGGTSVKIWRTGESDKVKFASGKNLTPERLVEGVKNDLDDWSYERVSIGYPGQVVNGRPAADPYNLAGGWVDFDYANALGCPVRIMNDACMQALGSYEGGKMLYLGLGTSMGTAFISDGKVIPLALGHLKFLRGESFEHYLSRKGLKLHGTKRWRKAAAEAALVLKEAFLADYVVLGGGNAKKLEELPEGCRRGGNHNAYFGGLRMWEDASQADAPTLTVFPRNDQASRQETK